MSKNCIWCVVKERTGGDLLCDDCRAEKQGCKTYEEAKQTCHVRSSIYRASKPEARFPKNHKHSLDRRVSLEDQAARDWMVFDPKEEG